MATYNFLDKTGLGQVWAKIKALIPTNTSDLTNDSGFITTVPEEIFIATYDTTTYAEVLEAYNAGKLLVCKYGSNYAELCEYSNSTFIFAYNLMTTAIRYNLASSGWSRGSLSLATSSAIPTNVSSLTNDSGYLTLSTLPIYDGSVS